MNNQERGNLNKTPAFFKQKGTGFEYHMQEPINPDIPCGNQMDINDLQHYYDDKLVDLPLIFKFVENPPSGGIQNMIQLVGEFEADLTFLEQKGIDVSAARAELKSLNPRLRALLSEE